MRWPYSRTPSAPHISNEYFVCHGSAHGQFVIALADPALEQRFRVFDDEDLQGRSQAWKRSALLW